jgi:glycosyltransferase involved in cell wall biosynthesis
MPMGILEAMSYGVPCLITQGTSLADLLDKYDAGWSCETTAEAIAEAIEKAVLEKQLLTKKSVNAIAAVKENFDPETIAKQTIKNYRKFI